MPRLPIPSDEGFSEETRAAVRHILQTRKSLPEQLPHIRRAGRSAALRPGRPPALPHVADRAGRSWLICTSARRPWAPFWNGHPAGPAGRRARRRSAVDTHGPLDGLTADEALIIRTGGSCWAPQVSDATFNAVRARYGAQGLLELTAVMSVYTMNAAICGDGPSGGGGRAAFDAGRVQNAP